MNKIFCIGHFKTGTTSYSLAARMLGFADLHFPLKYAEQLMAGGTVRWDDRPWDSMSNMNEAEYPQCDEAYPDSKFVLTTRRVNPWLKSIQKHLAMNWPPRLKKILDWRSELVFGVPCELDAYDETHFRKMFLRSEEAVLDYFHGPGKTRGRLLVLELESSTKMEDLSFFLGKNVPYPKMNPTTAESEQAFKAPGFPAMFENATKEGYPKEPGFMKFEEALKW